MKTIFTFSLSRTFVVMFAVVFLTHSLAGQTTHSVSVTNGSFTPKELTISAGDKVIWTNNGTNGHNVNGTTATFPSNPESFGNDVGLGWTYEFTFNIAGTYDYQCDPHAIYGMVGKVIVNAKTEEPLKLTVNFTGMTPHVGEDLWLAVIDKATNMEIGRVKKAVDAAAFSIEVPGIEMGKSYQVDFFADHNKNGVYDPAPADHTWRMQLDNVAGNSTLDFAHNTNFTDIAWKNKLTVMFTGMTPHIGEKLVLYLKQADTNAYVDTLMVDPVARANFDVSSYKIMSGKSYKIDFYADHNKNGVYDAPPSDHAWRITLNGVKGDTLVNFAHNTNFTDIFGPASHHITVSNGKFTPKEQTISVGDTVIWTNIEGSHNVNGTQATFPSNPESFGNSVGPDWTYKYVFNTAGTYDYHCDPHAAFGMVGKIIVESKEGTGPFMLTVNFTGMNPHVGETLWLAVIDQASHMEIGRIKTTAEVNFYLQIPGIEMGKSYHVDFFADHNRNGLYDTPPADHAWRMELNNVTGNSELNFAHNTNFTDIKWMNKLTVHFTGMTPHLNEMLTLYLVQKDNVAYVDTVMMESVATTEFDVVSYKIKSGMSYNIDFYADHNKNGVYDAPPADHAWRIVLDNVKGDTLVNFAHNTNFTDIFSTTLVPGINYGSDKITFYPNPASDYINLKVPENYNISAVKVYNINGAIIDSKSYFGKTGNISYEVSQLRKGIYFMEINSANRKDIFRFIKQ